MRQSVAAFLSIIRQEKKRQLVELAVFFLDRWTMWPTTRPQGTITECPEKSKIETTPYQRPNPFLPATLMLF